MHGATVSSDNSEIEIKSRGSEEHPGASKATDNPPGYFNVLNFKAKIPNTTETSVSGRKRETVEVVSVVGSCSSRVFAQ